MPGGGHLGDKLRKELAALVSDIRKDVHAHAVDFGIDCNLVFYPTTPTCNTDSITFEAPKLQIHDALDHFQTQVVHNTDLLSQTTVLDIPCIFENVILKAPILTANDVICHNITFSNLGKATPKTFEPKPHPIAKPKTYAQSLLTLKSATQAWIVTKLKTISRVQDNTRIRVRNQVTPAKLWTIPIRRSPIPPHRFTTEQKTKFRQALADKASTNPANVQIKVIFDRLTMSMFSAIDQDDRGNLLCTPRAELVGKQAVKLPPQPTTYLVMGSRTDTGAPIRALVPMDGDA